MSDGTIKTKDWETDLRAVLAACVTAGAMATLKHAVKLLYKKI